MENLQSDHLDTQNLYRDMQKRTGGEIYIGVVGPVRTGKSTFIKRFMDVAVLPYMEDAAQKTRAQDELPQSAGGRTITTTEPKFIPQEAVELKLAGEVTIRVRLVDCVGFMVEGAAGHLEDGAERLVKTPWYDHEIPFTQAAELGTRKVITDHSTIGVVVTTDGSFSDLPQETYLDAENQAISELKKLHKPFLVLVNSSHPSSRTAREAAERIEKQHSVTAMPVNCAQLSEEDIRQIMEQILYEFPVSRVEFYMPKWVEMLPFSHPLKTGLIEKIRELTGKIRTIRDVAEHPIVLSSEYVRRCMTERIDLADGCVRVLLDIEERYYYEMLSEYAGEKIENAQELLHTLRVLSGRKQEYDRVASAMEAVHTKGYGVVLPRREAASLPPGTIARPLPGAGRYYLAVGSSELSPVGLEELDQRLQRLQGLFGEEVRLMPPGIFEALFYEASEPAPVITAGKYAHRGSIQNLAGSDDPGWYSLETQVTADTPPAFFWHTVTDPEVPVQNSLLLAGALSAAGVRYEMHLYPRGVHGLSLATPEVDEPEKHRVADPHIAGWFGQCLEWLDILRTTKE